MNLVAYDREKLGGRAYYKKTEMLKLIDEFVESGMDCAKIEDWNHKTSSSCQSSFNNAIKRYKKGDIRAITRKGEVFLVKTND